MNQNIEDIGKDNLAQEEDSSDHTYWLILYILLSISTLLLMAFIILMYKHCKTLPQQSYNIEQMEGRLYSKENGIPLEEIKPRKHSVSPNNWSIQEHV